MTLIFNNNAKIVKIFVCCLLLFCFNWYGFAQNEGGKDPISAAIEDKKQENYLGSKLNSKEKKELERIYTKYKLSEEETKLKSLEKSGQKMKLFDRMKIAKANRKNYVRAKKLEKFRKNKVLSKQSDKTRKRMKKNHKRTNAKYKNAKRKQKRKSFFNLFR